MFKNIALLLISSLSLSSAALAETVINRGSSGDPVSLDQHRSTTLAEDRMLRELYEGLIAIDGSGRTVPGVARSWEISADGLTYRFHLRENARWSNGAALGAEDFVYSFRRIADPKTAAAFANSLFPIRNAQAVIAGKLPVEALGVRAIDAHTFEITLHKPNPFFFDFLASQSAFPLYRPSVEAHGDRFTQPANLVTNGAYVLSKYVPNDLIVMQKNANFWDADNVRIDRVNWLSFTDSASCMRLFETGAVDICPGVSLEQIDHIRAKLASSYHQTPFFGVAYLVVKGSEETRLQDPRVRRALSLLIDREFIAEKILRGTQLPAYSLVPRGIGNYVNDAPSLDFAGESMLDREDQAKALLAEAGVEPSSLKVKLRFASSVNYRNIMAAISSMFRNAGINAEIDEADSATYFNLLSEKGKFETSYATWLGESNDPLSFLHNYKTNDHFNYGDWSNAEYDALVTKAEETLDVKERAELLAQAERILLKESAYIPIATPTARSLVADKVKGYTDNLQNEHSTRWLSING